MFRLKIRRWNKAHTHLQCVLCLFTHTAVACDHHHHHQHVLSPWLIWKLEANRKFLSQTQTPNQVHTQLSFAAPPTTTKVKEETMRVAVQTVEVQVEERNSNLMVSLATAAAAANGKEEGLGDSVINLGGWLLETVMVLMWQNRLPVCLDAEPADFDKLMWWPPNLRGWSWSWRTWVDVLMAVV